MLTQADPIVKEAELTALQTFSVNFLAACKEKGVSFTGACNKAGIAHMRIYEMRNKTFTSRIGIYTLCNLALSVGCSLPELLIERPVGEASPQPKRKTYKK